VEKARVKLNKGFYGEGNQIAKPTVEEYKEITSGHGHH
jgi:ubiquinol-cytochrome c reductase cytochrome b subunit